MDPGFNRRQFLHSAAAAATVAVPGLALAQEGTAAPPSDGVVRPPISFALDGNRVRFFSPRVRRSFSVTMIADTHLFRDDVRGEPFRQYSDRMARAYHSTRHFQSGEETNPEKGFEDALAAARESRSSLVALVGDIVSFPSEAAVEWALGRVRQAGLPHLYTAGNHDWHYEGMEGSLDDLRSAWIARRLAPLYGRDHPMMSVRDIEGVRMVAIDNSTYEIREEQLRFFREQSASGAPLVLFVHIPLYAPGRPLGFGCGHPDWGAHSDRNAALERRVPWRKGGHTQVTLDFHREVFAAPQLLGVFAGHTHRASLDVVRGIPQFVTDANATGAFLQLEFIPA